jgi:hypothetical protein
MSFGKGDQVKDTAKYPGFPQADRNCCIALAIFTTVSWSMAIGSMEYNDMFAIIGLLYILPLNGGFRTNDVVRLASSEAWVAANEPCCESRCSV